YLREDRGYMTPEPSVGSTAMDASRSRRYLVFIAMLVIVMISIFSGAGSAQQMQNTTMNTTATTGGRSTQVANNSTTNNETNAHPPTPTPTPDANDGWENATPVGTERAANGTLPVGDQDWYVFPFESSGRIAVRFVAGNQTNVSAFLYDSGGKLLD